MTDKTLEVYKEEQKQHIRELLRNSPNCEAVAFNIIDEVFEKGKTAGLSERQACDGHEKVVIPLCHQCNLMKQAGRNEVDRDWDDATMKIAALSKDLRQTEADAKNEIDRLCLRINTLSKEKEALEAENKKHFEYWKTAVTANENLADRNAALSKEKEALEAEKICPNCHMPKTSDYHNPSSDCSMEYEYDKGIKDGLWFYDVEGLRAKNDQLQRILDDIPEVTTLQKECARLRDVLQWIYHACVSEMKVAKPLADKGNDKARTVWLVLFGISERAKKALEWK